MNQIKTLDKMKKTIKLVKVDECIDHYNANIRKENQPRMTRLLFGRKLFGQSGSDSTINAKVSLLVNGKRKISANELLTISKFTKLPIEKIVIYGK